MTKVPLSNISNTSNENTWTGTINANNAAITTAFDNTLSRDGTTPNQMLASIDMNSNRIFNLPAPVGLTEPVRLSELNTLAAGGTVYTVPAGGTTGQALMKKSNTNYDMVWGTVPAASALTPSMDGTGAVGTSLAYSREDHVHPTDTSRAPLASPTFTGTPAAPTATVGTNTTQVATTAFVLANSLQAGNNLSDVTTKYTALDNLTLKGADIAAAATLNLDAATGVYLHVTGNTGITAITLSAGRERIVYFTGTPTITASGTLTLPNGASSLTVEAGGIGYFVGGSTATRMVSYTPASSAGALSYYGTRTKLTADTTYYVRTDGNDSNTGLANSAGGAFLTIGKAMTVAGGLDCGSFQLTISVQAGTYTSTVTLPRMLSAVAPILTGVGNTTIISTTSSHCIIANGSTPWIVKNMKLTTVTTGNCLDISNGASLITDTGLEYGAAATYHVYVKTASSWQAIGNYTISGGAQYHLVLNGAAYSYGITVTLTGTPAFSGAYVTANLSGANYFASSMTFSGSATGPRFSVQNAATIWTGGGGANYFPGNSAGTGTNTATSPYGMYA